MVLLASAFTVPHLLIYFSIILAHNFHYKKAFNVKHGVVLRHQPYGALFTKSLNCVEAMWRDWPMPSRFV